MPGPRPTSQALPGQAGAAAAQRRSPAGTAHIAAGIPAVDSGVRCAACRRLVPTTVNFCRYCGREQPGSRWQRRLRLPRPDLSARLTVSPSQTRFGLILGVCLLVATAVAPVAVGTVAVGLATAAYLAALAFRLRLLVAGIDSPAVLTVDDAAARAVPDDELPVYTVLVPAYREPEVIGRLLASLDRIEYPRDRLDIRLLLEEDDIETRARALAARPGPHVTIVTIPPSEPRTKPKACNVGLAGARGELVTIYDAEDRPDPLQLRRAAVVFAQLPPDVACLQAKLAYHNAEQNLITRWFTAEYELWFGRLLPGLVAEGSPLPLGGTSNHFRRSVLLDVGGWDAFNVTEDADLGIRLHRLGFRTRVLESTTFEEANSDFVNWVKQRSRWYKGYLQTWLVHMRHPRSLWRELGPRGFLGFQLFVGGTPAMALLNPVFWALGFLWLVARPPVIQELYPAWIYYPAMLSLVAGNFAFWYAGIVGARASGRRGLTVAAWIAPLYWVMMSIAAIKAAVQLVAAPSFWEKTAHGLDAPAPDADHALA